MKAENYAQYETNLQRRLSLPKYYLSKWDYFEMNATSLTAIQLKQAKILYSTLGHLTEDERIFLGNKYRANYQKKHSSAPNYKLDEVASKEHSMTIEEYRKLRKGIELKFFYYMQNYVDERNIY